MRIENQFDVPVPVDEAWRLFVDVPRIAPCLPGATITEQLDDGEYRGTARVRLGPVDLQFIGQARFVEQDEATHTTQLSAQGRDRTGRGTARATITTTMLPGGGTTTVKLVTDLQLSGAVAQFGRQGIVTDVAQTLIDQFAECLRAQLSETTVAVESTGAEPAGTAQPALQASGVRVPASGAAAVAPPDRQPSPRSDAGAPPSPAAPADLSLRRVVGSVLRARLLRLLKRAVARLERGQ